MQNLDCANQRVGPRIDAEFINAASSGGGWIRVLPFFSGGGGINSRRMSGKPLLGLWLYRSGEEWNYKEDVPLTTSPVSKASVSKELLCVFVMRFFAFLDKRKSSEIFFFNSLIHTFT